MLIRHKYARSVAFLISEMVLFWPVFRTIVSQTSRASSFFMWNYSAPIYAHHYSNWPIHVKTSCPQRPFGIIRAEFKTGYTNEVPEYIQPQFRATILFFLPKTITNLDKNTWCVGLVHRFFLSLHWNPFDLRLLLIQNSDYTLQLNFRIGKLIASFTQLGEWNGWIIGSPINICKWFAHWGIEVGWKPAKGDRLSKWKPCFFVLVSISSSIYKPANMQLLKVRSTRYNQWWHIQFSLPFRPIALACYQFLECLCSKKKHTGRHYSKRRIKKRQFVPFYNRFRLMTYRLLGWINTGKKIRSVLISYQFLGCIFFGSGILLTVDFFLSLLKRFHVIWIKLNIFNRLHILWWD